MRGSETVERERVGLGIFRYNGIYATKTSNNWLSKRRLLDLKMNENNNSAEFLNTFGAHVNELVVLTVEK